VSRLRALRLLPLLLAAFVAAGAAGSVDARAVAPAPNDAAMEKLERIVRARVDSRRTTGIVAGMVFPDGETRVFAYGSAGGGKRLTASSVFEIGSITKVFTATVLADMVQRREVRLTDPVSSLLPPNVKVPSRNGRAITLEDLATHSSGLPREATNLRPKNPNNPFAGYDADQLYAFLKGYKLPRDPGAAIEYSNVGEGLLGHALALRAGKSYEELVRERILAPLGMTSTGIALTPEMASRLALGHRADGKVVPHSTRALVDRDSGSDRASRPNRGSSAPRGDDPAKTRLDRRGWTF
jgi:serine-type D-Ala-D-Ala carboxypeptidase/endopeptidase